MGRHSGHVDEVQPAVKTGCDAYASSELHPNLQLQVVGWPFGLPSTAQHFDFRPNVLRSWLCAVGSLNKFPMVPCGHGSPKTPNCNNAAPALIISVAVGTSTG
jgi:hypothetical protein